MSRKHHSDYMLTVLNGPNAGAQVRLAREGATLGHDENAEIVLDDVEVGATRISFSGNKVKLAPAPDGVAYADGTPVPPGAARTIDLPVTLNLSPRTQVNLCRDAVRKPETAARGAGSGLGRALPLFVLVAAIASVGGVGALAVISSPAEAPDGFGAAAVVDLAEAAPHKVPVEVATQAPAAAPEPEPDREHGRVEAAETLRALIKEAGLTGLEVTEDGGALRVRGYRTAEQAADWAAVRQRFDLSDAAGVPVLTAISEREVAAPIAVSSIWIGDTPELTTRDGQAYGIGDTVEGGWIIDAISRDAVKLRRGGDTVVLEF